jgi:hypothetical protein
MPKIVNQRRDEMLRKKAMVLIYALIVLMLISISVLAEEARPLTGTTFKLPKEEGHGILEIINDNPQMDAVAVLNTTNTTDESPLEIYIRSNDTAKYSGIMDGWYNLYFETGNNWISSSDKFTDKGGFYRLNRSLQYETTSPALNSFEYPVWTVTLNSTAINANESAREVTMRAG